MAVAVKLSRKLYETLGDEAAEDMVAWMDSVERNRAELREVNDMAFARIDARFGEADARIDARFKESDARIDIRFAQMEARFETRLIQEIGRLESKIDQRFADLIKWSFVFWTGTNLMMLGIALAVMRQGR